MSPCVSTGANLPAQQSTKVELIVNLRPPRRPAPSPRFRCSAALTRQSNEPFAMRQLTVTNAIVGHSLPCRSHAGADAMSLITDTEVDGWRGSGAILCHRFLPADVAPKFLARVSSENPRLKAFCRIAPSVLFKILAIFLAGVFFFESVFNLRI